MSIHVYQRPAIGTTFVRDITHLAWPTWRDTTRAMGGHWTADFSIQNGQTTVERLWDIYHNYIGRRIQRKAFGMVQWDGIIYEMTITVNGSSYMTTLDPETFHNKVRVQYTYPRVEDSQVGNLDIDPGISTSTFQDDAQDFSDWATTPPGTAVYECVVTCDDDTTVQFYCGEVATTTNPNDSIRTYLDVALTTQGWNGEQAGKTPVSYTISNVERAGVAEQTAWGETTDSSDEYGEACYIDVRGEMYPAAAESIRDRGLAQCAYPKSVPVGGLANDSTDAAGTASLDVVCAGFVYTMNWRYLDSDIAPDYISDQVSLLVDGTADAAEFVSAGTVDSNTTITLSLAGGNLAMRLWDQCEELAEMGDTSDNRWIAGVYNIPAGARLNYEAAETNVRYYWRYGRLVNHAGQSLPAEIVRPNIIVQIQDIPFGITAGSGSEFHNPRHFYVEEVEFVAPRSYRLTSFEGDTLYGTY